MAENQLVQQSNPQLVAIQNALKGANKSIQAALKENAGTFNTSLMELITSDANLMKCDPKKLMAEAVKAASLKLPLNKQIGYAYLVPYGTTPNLIIGFRGYIQLATRPLYEKIESLIEGINEEQKNLVSQLSDLERREDMARSYQDRQNAVLEEKINEHFSLVQWRMFRTVNNGGDPYQEPYCECYVNGVAYHDGLNQAARLNAGLDIINTLCKHYDVYAPIVVDNSESNLNILDTDSQQIRLEVFDSELQIL